jgi:hypothetical protein
MVGRDVNLDKYENENNNHSSSRQIDKPGANLKCYTEFWNAISWNGNINFLESPDPAILEKLR